MYILTRYVVWEVLKTFVAALVGLTLMVTLGMGFSEGYKMGLPTLVMLRTMPFMMPEMLGITIPVAMLYAVSSVFGRMTGANEIVAIKSLGINPMVVVWPVVVLAGFLSLGTVWMYELAATWSRPSVERTVCESFEEIAYGMLQKNHSLEGENFPFSITVKRVEGRKLIQPTIILKSQPGHPPTTIAAEEAELWTDRSNPARPVLRLRCVDSRVDTEGIQLFNPGEWLPPGIPIVVPPPDRHHRDWVAMWDIPRSIAELRAEIDSLKRQLEGARELRESFQKANKILGIVEPHDNVERIADQIADRQFKILRLKTEPYRRWSNGFTCLCFTLIGIPVAMLWRHADALTNFFVCFLPILALYYPLLMLSENLSTSGTLPPIAFWMSNVVLTIPAVALLRWINNH